jgi:hypothetical protein
MIKKLKKRSSNKDVAVEHGKYLSGFLEVWLLASSKQSFIIKKTNHIQLS